MSKLLERIVRDIRLLIGLGRIADVDDTQDIQAVLLDMGDGETRLRKRYQDYGLSTVPPNGARVVTGAIGGRRSFLTALRADAPAFRPRGNKRGEVVLYTMFGDMIHLKAGRIIYVKAGTRLDVDAPQAHFLHDVVIDGTLRVAGATTLESTLGVTGEMTLAANLAQTGGNITTTGTVTIGGLDFAAHGHGYTDNGNPLVSGTPVGVPP